MLDFVGNALAPNVLTIERDVSALSRKRESMGLGPIEMRFPDRRAMGGAPAGTRPTSPLVDGDGSWEGAGLLASFGFAPMLGPRADEVISAARGQGGPDATPFETAYPRVVSDRFLRSAIVGSPAPTCGITVYGVSPFVIMVDGRELGGLPVPGSWEELCDPAYRGKVAISAEPPSENVATLGMLSLYGDAGMRSFLANVALRASASVMGMECGRRRGTGIAVYVAPWFFARMCRERPGVSVVWPREGALAFPLWLALRRDATDAARAICSYLMGDGFARESAGECLPCANPAGDCLLPEPGDERASLHWMGWDFLSGLDLPSLAGELDGVGIGDVEVRGARPL